VTNVSVLSREFEDQADREMTLDRRTGPMIPAGVDVYEIDGPFFFGAAESFKNAVSSVARKPKALVIRLRRVPVIDSTGLATLRDLISRSRQEGTRVILTEVHSQPVVALTNAGLLDELGEDNVAGTLEEALAGLREPAEPSLPA